MKVQDIDINAISARYGLYITYFGRSGTRHYPFLARLRRARGVIVWQLEVIIQACHVFPFPLPADFQTIQLVCTCARGHTV